MTKITVNFSMSDNVKRFVNAAGKYTFDIDLKSGRYVVDGKSMLGIFSLNLSKGIACEIHAEPTNQEVIDFLNEIDEIVVK